MPCIKDLIACIWTFTSLTLMIFRWCSVSKIWSTSYGTLHQYPSNGALQVSVNFVSAVAYLLYLALPGSFLTIPAKFHSIPSRSVIKFFHTSNQGSGSGFLDDVWVVVGEFLAKYWCKVNNFEEPCSSLSQLASTFNLPQLVQILILPDYIWPNVSKVRFGLKYHHLSQERAIPTEFKIFQPNSGYIFFSADSASADHYSL